MRKKEEVGRVRIMNGLVVLGSGGVHRQNKYSSLIRYHCIHRICGTKFKMVKPGRFSGYFSLLHTHLLRRRC